MKGLLFICLVGAAIYGALVVTHDLLPSDTAEVAAPKPNNAHGRQLRSWGSNLPALASSTSQEVSLPLHKSPVMPGLYESDRSQHSNGSPAPGEASTSAQDGGTADAQSEWANVVLAARVHSEASVSSPTIRFYQAGTALRVVGRESGWLQVIDFTSGERGWVFEKYLAPTGSPTVTQTAQVISDSKTSSEPKRINPTPKKHNSSRPADEFAFAQFDPQNSQWSRRAPRRGGLGFFFFRRLARAEPAMQ